MALLQRGGMRYFSFVDFLVLFDPQANGAPAFANTGWAAVFALRNALKGKADSVIDNKASLLTAMRAFKGPVPLGADTLNCGGYPQWGPAVCTTEGVIAQVQGGKFVKYSVK